MHVHVVSPLQVIVPFDRFPLYQTYIAPLHGNMGMYRSHPATNNKKQELINWPGAGDMWDLAKAQKVCLQHEARSKAFMVEVEVTISSFVKDTSQVDTCLLKNVWSCHYLRSYETWKCQVHKLSEVLRDMVGFKTTGLLRRTQLFEFTCWCLFLVLVCSRSNRCIGTRCIRVFKHSTFLIHIRTIKFHEYFIFSQTGSWNILKWNVKHLFSPHDLSWITRGLLLHGLRLLLQQMQGLVPLHLRNSCAEGIVGHQVLEKWLAGSIAEAKEIMWRFNSIAGDTHMTTCKCR